MSLAYLAIGLIIGAVAGWLFGHSKEAPLTAMLEAERELRKSDKTEYEQRLQAQKTDFERQTNKNFADLRSSYEQQIALFREQLTNISRRAMQESSRELFMLNNKQMDSIVKPLNENISRMEQTMARNNESSVKRHASLEQTIQHMVAQTVALGQQADRLSNALLHKNKTAGNWGELVLNELLESQGLQKGVHFDAQYTLRDEGGRALLNDDTGSRMIPDVVLHLADNRDVIIDSKMSLASFVDYRNAETDNERKQAVMRLINSIRGHVRELSGKQYQDYVKKPRISAGFVIMFVPIEGALQLALAESPELWREAFEKKVFIVGAQTLIAALRIIDLTWVNVKQERNTLAVMEEARKLVDRVQQFYDRFQDVGRRISDVKEAYDRVSDKVSEGKQSIMASGRALEDLGVRGKKQLSSE